MPTPICRRLCRHLGARRNALSPAFASSIIRSSGSAPALLRRPSIRRSFIYVSKDREDVFSLGILELETIVSVRRRTGARWDLNSGSVTSRSGPRERITARSITFSSSRTFPGQLYSDSAIRVLAGIDSMGFRKRVAKFCANPRASKRNVLATLAKRRYRDRKHV